MRLRNIRCFKDTGELHVSPTCNIVVGTNNTGKSTLLRAITGFQGFPFTAADCRPGSTDSFHEIVFDAAGVECGFGTWPTGARVALQFVMDVQGQGSPTIPPDAVVKRMSANTQPFYNGRPRHQIVPFIARRKAMQFDETVNAASQTNVTGTFNNLFSRVDLLATSGHSAHDRFRKAVKDIVGLDITTRASLNGKKAGFYLNDQVFIPMEQMGDGVPELVGLIVELCVEKNKVFVLEEPETNLHPAGLKALLAMVRDSWKHNQFFVATHSNIVLRELGFDPQSKVFCLTKGGDAPDSITKVSEVERTTTQHAEVLRELGYEFSDLALHDGWLFLEEASAESIINQVLIPMFVPALTGRLRTFSTGGVSNVEPSIGDFQRLVTFVHLQPAYEGRLWVRVDGDASGAAVIARLRERFGYLTDDKCAAFSETDFERYYPAEFQEVAGEAIADKNKTGKREKKAALLKKVLTWTRENPEAAKALWMASAAEPIALLNTVAAEML
jgi:predicted ATP-dependent endonuclease of OLD family